MSVTLNFSLQQLLRSAIQRGAVTYVGSIEASSLKAWGRVHEIGEAKHTPASSLAAFMTPAARPKASTMLSMREKPIVRAQLSVASNGSSTAARSSMLRGRLQSRRQPVQ